MDGMRARDNRRDHGAARGTELLRTAAWIAAALLSSLAPAQATTVVPMSVENLTRSSDAVVLGTVVDTRSATNGRGRIRTLVDLAVEDVLKGTVAGDRLTLQEPGGRIGELQEVIFGAPEYRPAQRVLVFIRVAADGTLQTNHLAQGKFDIEAADGAPAAVQSLGPGTTVIARGGAALPGRMPLSELLARIAGAAGSASAPEPVAATAAAHQRPAPGAGGFTLLGGGRFFEPDQGLTLSFVFDDRGDSILGLDVARDAVNQAFAAWNDVTNASITLADGGLTSDLTGGCAGAHLVRFDDPEDAIADPVECTGTLAVGGYCSTGAEIKSFNDGDFTKAVRAVVTFADHWQGCEDWTPCNVAEVATHEVGHAIGLGHSSEDLNEPSPRLKEATMYFRAAFDGRCAAVRADDIDGIGFLYPTSPPPTITTTMLAEGATFQPYEQVLAAIGSGTLVWSEGDGVCQGFPGLMLTAAGVIQGTPMAFGGGCFDVVVTDGNGDSHAKRLDLTVIPPGNPTSTPRPTATATVPLPPTSTATPRPPTPTSTPLATSTPTLPLGATPTATATRSAQLPCIGDCDNDGSVDISELIRGVGIALGTNPRSVCPPFDADENNQVSVNELIAGVNASLNGCPA